MCVCGEGGLQAAQAKISSYMCMRGCVCVAVTDAGELQNRVAHTLAYYAICSVGEITVCIMITCVFACIYVCVCVVV